MIIIRIDGFAAFYWRRGVWDKSRDVAPTAARMLGLAMGAVEKWGNPRIREQYK